MGVYIDGVLQKNCIATTAAWDGRNDKSEIMESGTYYYVLVLGKGLNAQQGYMNLIK